MPKLAKVDYKLSATELLFFPKSYDPRPLSSTIDHNDSVRRKNYIEKIKSMPFEEKRINRAKRDARYLHKNADKSNETEQEPVFCYNQLTGRCNDEKECGRLHQLRKPIFFGVCKYYISGLCANGSLCSYMHEDFPCRYFYTDTEHPKSHDANNCRFNHGGRLSEHLVRYFKKQMEFWVKKITKTTPEKFDTIFTDLINKFDAKQEALEQSHCVEREKKSTTIKNDEGFDLKKILRSKQIKALTDDGITTVEQISQTSVDYLLDYGLNMDQIYKITTEYNNEKNKLKNETCQVKKDTCEMNVGILKPVESTYNDNRLADIPVYECSEMNGNSLRGFTVVELKTAEDILQTKWNTFDIIFYGNGIETLNNVSIESNKSIPMETDLEVEIEKVIVTETKTFAALHTKMITEIEVRNQSEIEEEIKISQNSTSEVINKEQNTISENEYDSDNEFDLVINEEI